MSISWLIAGLLGGPQMARIEMHYETEPSGYRAHWTFDEVRVGTLPALAIRGPKEQHQMMELDFQIPEEGVVQFKIQIMEDQEVDGAITRVPVLKPTMMTQWGQEAQIVTNQRERLKRFGRNRWLDVRVELRLTAWPIENVATPTGESPNTHAPESVHPTPPAPDIDASEPEGANTEE